MFLACGCSRVDEGMVPEHSEMCSLHVFDRLLRKPAWLKALNIAGVRIVGEVDDAKTFIRRHHLMIAPLYAGGGIRIKILEAMALGTVTLNTTLALEGIPATDRCEALIADTPEALLQQLRFAFQHPEVLSAIATRARRLMETEFDQQLLAKRLLAGI